MVLPLLRLKRFDQYTTTYSVNVAELTTTLAEALGFGVALRLHSTARHVTFPSRSTMT